MNPFLIAALVAVVFGAAGGAAVEHHFDAGALATEKAAHANDIAKINAASAQALSDALAKQQVAEGKVSDLETQYQTEVANHAKDALNYRSQLASGAQRLRVRVTSCSSGASGSQSPASASGSNDAPATADLDPTVASGIVQVAADDQAEIDKLTALQAYVKALQDQGYIGK